MIKDLYGILDVKRDATPAQINSAYRKLSKKHHPDAGGDPAVFDRIARAKSLLLDPAKRAKYDATGELDDGPDNAEAMVFQAVMQTIQRVAMSIAQRGEDPETMDLVTLAGLQMRQDINELNTQLALIPQNIEKALGLAKRFRNRKGEPNQIGLMFQSQARDFERGADMIRRQIHVNEQAQKMLESYAFDAKSREHVIMTWNVGFSA